MLIRCRDCNYDRTGLSLDARCPECGSKRAYAVAPPDWGRFRRWPGVLVPVGLTILVCGAGLTLIKAVGLIWCALAILEGVLIAALGLVRWA